MAKHPSRTLKWKWQSLKNWFYDKWMRLCGNKPYQFDIYKNRYTYIKSSELDEFVREAEAEEPEYEEVFYQRQPSNVWYRQENKEKDITARMAVAKALREGRSDARIIRRSLPGG